MSQCRTDSPQYHEPPEAPEWAVNAAQERLEERAEEEFRTGHAQFRRWLMDTEFDPLDLAPLMSAAADVYSNDGRSNVDDAIQDFLLRYKQWRSNSDELSELIREVQEDAREEA